MRRMPRLSAIVCTTALLALMGGCSLFGTPKKPPEPLPAPVGTTRIEQAWSVSIGKVSGVGFAPAVVGTSVWAASREGSVVRLDLATGQSVWRVNTSTPLSAGVGTDGSTAVVVTRDGELIAFDEAGKQRWSAKVGGEVTNPPAVADGTVLLRTSDNRVIAWDAQSGQRRWVFSRQNPPLVLRNSGGFAMLPGIGFVGMPGGRLVALSLANGAPRWDTPLATPKGANELERIADVVGSPLVIGREVCAVTYQGRIGCLDVVSGSPIWVKDFSSAAGFDVDNRGLVAPDAEDVVHAFDRRGSPAWQQKGFARRQLSAPLIFGSLVAVGDLQGNVLWLSRDDGSLRAINATDGKPIVAPAAAAAGTIVVQTSGGTLVAFRGE
jgi:outer membrane protein assembly factor BamB